MGHLYFSGKPWKTVALSLLAALLLAISLAGPLLVVRDPLHPAGAIVVIGGDHKPERVQCAVELYRQGHAPLVIISAGTPVLEGAVWLPEAEVMRRQALALGLPEQAIVMKDRLMRGIIRLIDALLRGDSSALYILAFAVGGTLLIFLVTECIQYNRRRQRQGADDQSDRV